MDQDIRHIITRELLIACAKREAPLDGPRKVRYEDIVKETDLSIAWPALLWLSKLGPEQALSIDFMTNGVLPPPEDRDFSLLAFGLVALIDQGPRTLFSGVNNRYTNGYFDPMAFKLLRQLMALPSHLTPWAKHRWVDGLGYHVTQWIWVQIMFIVSSPHSEVLEQHDWHIRLFHSIRSDIRDATGLENPYEKDLEGGLMKDIYAFPRVAMAGPPTTETLGREAQAGDVFWWYYMIIFIHRPIIATFGRYPYRNSGLARPSTEKELLWIKDTNGFATIDEESAEKIKEDVEKGVWSPLEQQ